MNLKKNTYAEVGAGVKAMSRVIKAMAFSLPLVASPCYAVTTPFVMDTFDILSTNNGIGASSSDYPYAGDLLNELSESSAIRNLLEQAISDLAAGKQQLGREKLKQAWSMDYSLPVAGILLANSHLKAKEFDAVLDVTQKIQTYSPRSVEAYTLAGIANASKQDFIKARSSFEKALELRPNDAEAGVNLSQIYIELKQDNKARELLVDLVSNNPDNYVPLNYLLNLEIKSGHLENAVSALESSISKNPGDFHRRIALVQIYLGSNQMPKALATSAETMNKFPEQPDVVEMAGVVYMLNGSFEKAQPLLESAVKLSPERVSAHYNLALLYEKLKQSKSGISEIEKALKLNPSHVPSKFVLARLLAATGQLDLARNILKELELSNAGSVQIPELKGRIAVGQNKFEEAVAHFKSALNKQPDNPQLVMQLAFALIADKKSDAGYGVLRDWIGKHPNDISVRVTLADMLLGKSQFDEAEKYYTQVLELQPGRLDVLNNLAWLLSEKGELNKAIDLAEKNYNSAPKNPLVVDTFATILLKKGMAEKAAELLRDAVSLAPDNTAIKYHLAQSLVDTNNDEAKELLKKLLADHRDFKERELVAQLLKKLASQ
ncbi:hypothetical protein A1507_09380 [Methylomonas koyamae]|uniref:Uncharacterized protein n=1 Tax=Methylomonas koyamae TaxID=702114 RepID=A0A177NKW4_9GAMM|nr:XrtA/PEP-CTERM system TPR-repeat protein PrsT [Methylomonas koyamae]OAI18555.1 hypothetical protein A1507_09380 [Methylomonas koyamae]